jgi:uncharacterized iron-regulated membrane protein
LAAAETAVPGSHATYLSLADTGGEGVHQIYLESPGPNEDAEPTYRLAYVDPGTGEVNGVRDEEAGFVWWTYRSHMYLWQDHGVLGLDGDDFVAWLAVAWIWS